MLHFLDGLEATRRRRDMMLSSAVASGIVSAVQAFPDLFDLPPGADSGAFPSTDADMTAFELEPATPQSFAADIEALVQASQRITLREEQDPEPPRLTGQLPHVEWT